MRNLYSTFEAQMEVTTKFLKRLTYLMMGMSLVSCGSENNSTIVEDSTGERTSLVIVAAKPTDLLNHSFPPDTAFTSSINSACLANGSTQPLSDDGNGGFTETFVDANPADCFFSLSFSFTDRDYGSVELIFGSKQAKLDAGKNILLFEQSDYFETDSDGDGIANTIELSEPVRSHPFQRPLWGEMAWGKEVWTAK